LLADINSRKKYCKIVKDNFMISNTSASSAAALSSLKPNQNIDTKPVPNDPKATISKMDKIIKAAKAPDATPEQKAAAIQAQSQKLKAEKEMAAASKPAESAKDVDTTATIKSSDGISALDISV
jgi:nucleoid-associated protein YgaU